MSDFQDWADSQQARGRGPSSPTGAPRAEAGFFRGGLVASPSWVGWHLRNARWFCDCSDDNRQVVARVLLDRWGPNAKTAILPSGQHPTDEPADVTPTRRGA